MERVFREFESFYGVYINGKVKEKIMNFKIAGIIGLWLSTTITGIGVGIAMAIRADIGFVLITAGALLFALFIKIRILQV